MRKRKTSEDHNRGEDKWDVAESYQKGRALRLQLCHLGAEGVGGKPVGLIRKVNSHGGRAGQTSCDNREGGHGTQIGIFL